MIRSLARAVIYAAPGECERCPACGSAHLYDLDLLPLRWQNRVITGFVSGCDQCGLVFSNPQPSPEELQRLYSPSGDWGRPRAGGAPEPAAGGAPERGQTARTSWSRMFDPIRDELPVTSPAAGAKVLDFGCGAGELLDRLQECGWDTWGVEPSVGDAFPRHHKIEEVPASPTFDLIIAHHVLEHVSDPLTLLRQFAGACRPGGFLFVGVPRFDTLPDHRDYKYVINGHAHVTAYTWSCLHWLLARAGWSPVAPPPDRISKGRGRMTSARLRVLARRVAVPIAPPPAPATAARSAIRGYHSAAAGRPLFERLRWYRLAARQRENRRRRDLLTRKAEKAKAVSAR